MKPILAVPASVLLAGCAGLFSPDAGLDAGRLKPCGSGPRCVSSQMNDERHGIAPLTLAVEPARAWLSARDAVAALPRASIVTWSADYLHAEVISPWHFYTDDLELLLNTDAGVIDVRSTTRLGYYDFEVNRERVEALRKVLAKQGAVAP